MYTSKIQLAMVVYVHQQDTVSKIQLVMVVYVHQQDTVSDALNYMSFLERAFF